MIHITNKIKITIASMLAVILVTVIVVVFVWQPYETSNESADNSDIVSTPMLTDNKTVVDKIKDQELQAENDKKIAETKASYGKLRQSYLEAGNNDKVIEIDAQIYKLDHPSDTTAITTTSTATGTGKAGN